jgi:CRISPR/Cas system CSM-associated protein Csm2 small subunit
MEIDNNSKKTKSNFYPPVRFGIGPFSFNAQELANYILFLTNYFKQKSINEIKQSQRKGRQNQNLYKYLKFLFKDISDDHILEFNNHVFPCVVYPATKSQRYDIESIIDKPLKLNLSDQCNFFEFFDQLGQPFLKRISDEIKHYISKVKKFSKDFQNKSIKNEEELKKNIESLIENLPDNPWDDKTYTMEEFSFKNSLLLSCSTGTYYRALKSCDMVEIELLREFSDDKVNNETYENITNRLYLMSFILSKGNPLYHSLGRSVAIGISTLIVFPYNNKEYATFLNERSKSVAVHQNLLHVIPSFMFQPVSGFYEDEFSVKHNIYREYLEELFYKSEISESVERPSGEMHYQFFYYNDNLRYLQSLEENKNARFFLTGLCINLLNLRPEICTLLLITDPEWYINQGQGKEVKGYKLNRLKLNWEFHNQKNIRYSEIASKHPELFRGNGVFVLKNHLELPDDILKPSNFVPPGIAALKLGIEVAKEELGIK